MRLSRFTALASIFLLTASMAQTTQGGIVGTVQDQKGDAIAGAKITVIQSATGLQRDVTSGDNGLFRVLAIPNGTYEIRAEAPGFATAGEGHRSRRGPDAYRGPDAESQRHRRDRDRGSECRPDPDGKLQAGPDHRQPQSRRPAPEWTRLRATGPLEPWSGGLGRRRRPAGRRRQCLGFFFQRSTLDFQ